MLQKDSSGHRYYSAVDADTNGSEGDYYVWEYEEIKSVLKENFDEFSKEYGVLKEGNWEGGKNILHRIKKYLPKETMNTVLNERVLYLRQKLEQFKYDGPVPGNLDAIRNEKSVSFIRGLASALIETGLNYMEKNRGKLN